MLYRYVVGRRPMLYRYAVASTTYRLRAFDFGPGGGRLFLSGEAFANGPVRGYKRTNRSIGEARRSSFTNAGPGRNF